MAGQAVSPVVERTWRALPVVGVVVLALTWGREINTPVAAVVGVLIAGTVLAAVHHAEVIALRVGEPYGSLVLAVAVTVVEVGLIVTLMLGGDDKASTLARDTVFAAVMISVNGIVGLSLLVAARRHEVPPRFNAEGTGAALATVATLATLCLVLPTFTLGEPGPVFTPGQLAFAAVASLVLYGVFVLTQTVRHRDFFLPVSRRGEVLADDHADPPSDRQALAAVGFLLVALVGVVGLAKVESVSIERAVEAAGLPLSFVGVVIALLVLLPETIAAVNASRRERTQVSLNLAFGSAMASIGLTIPTIAIASIWLPTELELGLGGVQIVLLALSVVVGVLTVVPGRATRLQASLHLALLAAFVFLSISP